MPRTIDGQSTPSRLRPPVRFGLGLALFNLALILGAQSTAAFTTTVVTLDGTAGTNSAATGYVPASTDELALWFAFGSVSPVFDRTFGPNGDTRLQRVGQPVTPDMPYGSLVAAFASGVAGVVPAYMQFLGEQGVINFQLGHVGQELHVGLNMSAADYSNLDGLMQVVLFTAAVGEFTEYNFVIDSKGEYPFATGIHPASGDVLAFINSGDMARPDAVFYGPEGRPLLNNALQPLVNATFGAVCGSFSPSLADGFVIGDNGSFVVQPSDNGQELLLYPNIGSTQVATMQGTFHLRVYHLHSVATSTDETPDFGPGLTSWPNPTPGSSVVAFSLAESMETDLSVYDVTGKLVRRLASQRLPMGRHRFTWDGRNTSGAPVAAGVYFHRLTTPNRQITSKVIVAH